jgi:hypothetical protein
MSEEKEESRKRGGVIILWSVIVLLMISNVVTIWLWKTSKQEIIREKIVTEQVIVERDNVKADLLLLQKDFEDLQGKDAAMQQDIEEKKERIAELIKQAEKHKGDAYIISQLRKETETLRSIMKGYVRREKDRSETAGLRKGKTNHPDPGERRTQDHHCQRQRTQLLQHYR